MPEATDSAAPQHLTIREFHENAVALSEKILESGQSIAITNMGRFIALISRSDKSVISGDFRRVSRLEFLHDSDISLKIVAETGRPTIVTDDNEAWLHITVLSDEEMVRRAAESENMANRQQAAASGQTYEPTEALARLAQL